MRLKSAAVAIAVSLFTSVAPAQTARTWSKSYGGTWIEKIRSLDVMPDGDLLVLTKQKDDAITRFSPDGVVKWNRLLGGLTQVFNPQVRALRNGGAVVGGSFIESNARGITEFVGFVFVLDVPGNVLWAKRYSAGDELKIFDVRPTTDGGFVVGAAPTRHAGSIIKLSSTGEVQWSTTYDVSGSEQIAQILQMRDGGYLAAGTLRGSPWLLRVSSKGALQWQKSYATNGAKGTAVALTSDGGAVFVGHVGEDGWVLKLKSDGLEEWQLRFPFDGNERFESVIETPDGNLLIGGTTKSFGAGKGDVWVVRLDRAGKTLWQRVFGGPAAEGSAEDTSALVLVGAARDGTAFIGSSTDSFSAGLQDLWLLKIDANGNASPCAPGTVTNIAAKAVNLPVFSLAIETSPLEVLVQELNVQLTPTDLNSAEACTPAEAVAAAEASLKLKVAAAPPRQPSAVPEEALSAPLRGQPPQPAVSPPHASRGPVHLRITELLPFEAQVQRLMNARDFKALEKLASELAGTKARFPSGYWKLESFYNATFPSEAFKVTPEQYLEIVDSWIKVSPISATPLIAKAKYLDALASLARGGGYGNTVTETGWEEYERRGRQALEVLKQAGRLKPRDPEFYTTLIQVLGGHGGSAADMDEALKRGVEIEPTYFPLYFNRAFYLTPQWGGEDRDVERFAARSADQTRGQIGEEVYARLAWMIFPGVMDETFKKHGFAWPRVKQGFLDIQKRFPGASRMAHVFARLSYHARDRATTRAVFALPQTAWNQDGQGVWYRAEYDAARTWALGPAEAWIEGASPATSPTPTPAPTPTPTPTRAPSPAQSPSGGMAASFVDDFARNWPKLVMPVEAALQDGTKASGTGFLIDVNGSIYGVSSAGIFAAPGKQVTSADLRLQLADLTMKAGKKSLSIGRLMSSTKEPAPQGIAFTLAKPPKNWPVKPLKARQTGTPRERRNVYLVQCHRVDAGECEQRVYRARIFGRGISTGREFGSLDILQDGDEPLDYDRFVGSPIIDEDGLAIGVITGKGSLTGNRPVAAPGEELGLLFGWDIK